MTASYRFTRDLSELPTHAFGHRSLTWWGVIAFMMIEGAGFAMAIAAYFFLFANQGNWPPEPFSPPGLVPGLFFTLVILLSELPNTLEKKAAEAGNLGQVRLLLVVMSALGGLLLVIRAFEFGQLNVSWTDNPYGSILWALLVLHTTHILTDWIDTLVLTALMFSKHGDSGRRHVDVSENALYWRFVWLTWLPIWTMIYWVPRWS
ncbi:cytochrome C oxidase subunit III [Sphingomonas sp. ID1715]|uniref:cytochrome c oxidase subunit 3 n=1 Tax=Sphingomonas sp. ID1715 TaxID=1656898 RepID=UPI0014882089|nr:cytochrome c oxidase subunit 3 [Sphingomonas sp. ID1715]NNM76276.1 cytochrome C oxidase subunit III [Sphingomonas sp. ID1715]